MKSNKKKKWNLKFEFKPYIFIIMGIIVLTFPLIGNKVVYGDDYEFHITNLVLNQNYINILKLDLLIPKVFGGSIANGFGYGTGIFYPPLSYYLTCYISYFLKAIHQNTILSITYLQILIVIFSSITMYKLINRVANNKYIATIGSLSYISSTYFLCNIYGRVAIAESLTFIFIPIVFLSLYELFYGNENKFSPLFIVGYLGMINSHLVLSVYLTIIILLLLLCNLKKVLKKEKIKKLIISSILVLLISTPFLVPLLEHKIHTNYSVFEPNFTYPQNLVEREALSISEFLRIHSGKVKKYFNYIILILSILTIILKKKTFEKEENPIFKISIFVVLISIFLCTKYFPWKYMPEILKSIQFPWRMLVFVSFGMAFISGYIIKAVNKKYKTISIIVISILIILSGYISITQNLITKPVIPKTMHMGIFREYLPQKANDNAVYYFERNQDIALIEGNAKITINKNNSPYLNAKIELESTKVIIELPRIYYLGYEIKLTGDNGKIEKIKYYENDNGFIELEVNKTGTLEVLYEGTIANKISNYICLITIITCIIILIYKNIKNKSN